MSRIFSCLVVTGLLSLTLSAEDAVVSTMTSLTCVKTDNGYPTERMMLEKTEAGYRLMHQTMGQKFFDRTNKTVAADMTCQFSPTNKKLLACSSADENSPLYLSSKLVSVTTLNDFFGMMTTEKIAFMDFEMHVATADGMTTTTTRYPSTACRVKTDKPETDDNLESDTESAE